jgi:hypothetical protein
LEGEDQLVSERTGTAQGSNHGGQFDIRCRRYAGDDQTVANHLAAYAHRNPLAERLYRRSTGIDSDAGEETFLKMAPFYPTMVVRRDSIRADSTIWPPGKASS